MASPVVHSARMQRSLQKGSVEPVNGGYAAWMAGKGFVSQRGGFTKDPSKALVVSGPGDAIRLAAVHGFAITSW